MLPSILEKMFFGPVVVVLFILQRASAMILGFAIVDMILAALFLTAYLRTSPRNTPSQVDS
jgi:succinate dehydrogenase/fumarate reductase cytochrome b subunit